MHSCYSSGRPVTFRRASGTGRSALLATGTIDRSGFALGISTPGAYVIAWGLDHAHDGLTPGMHMDVFHRDLLLALAAMMIERVDQGRIGPG